MTTGEYDHARAEALGQIRRAILNNKLPSSSITMQYDQKLKRELCELCAGASDILCRTLADAISELEQGALLTEFLTPELVTYHKHHNFSQNADGGRLSALYDTALLIATLDTSQCDIFLSGIKREAVKEYTNRALSTWLLKVNEVWEACVSNQATMRKEPLFKVSMPRPDREEAGPVNLLLIVWQAFAASDKISSPYKSKCARSFARIFAVKHWSAIPVPETNAREEIDSNTQCPLPQISAGFQEWYFSVGQTQMSDDAQLRHHQEETAVKLRNIINERARCCSGGCSDAFSCVARLKQDIDQQIPPHKPFRENCVAVLLSSLKQ